jgi:flagellar assembly protein FliH
MALSANYSQSEGLFAEDFDLPEAAAKPKVVEPVFSVSELTAAREAAWREGHAAGLQEAAAADAAATKRSVAQIAAQLRAEVDVAREAAEQHAEMIAQLLLGSLAATLPALSARYGDAEVRAIVRTVLPQLCQEPAITIRAHPVMAAAVEQGIGELDPELKARVQTVACDDMAPGDARIAWRNGSVVRDTAALWRQVANILAPAGLLRMDEAVKEMADGN